MNATLNFPPKRRKNFKNIFVSNLLIESFCRFKIMEARFSSFTTSFFQHKKCQMIHSRLLSGWLFHSAIYGSHNLVPLKYPPNIKKIKDKKKFFQETRMTTILSEKIFKKNFVFIFMLFFIYFFIIRPRKHAWKNIKKLFVCIMFDSLSVFCMSDLNNYSTEKIFFCSVGKKFTEKMNFFILKPFCLDKHTI